MQSFFEYPTWDSEKLLAQLSDVVSQMAGLAEEIAMVQVSERRAKADGFLGSTSETLGGRERDAEFNSLDLTCTVFELKGRLSALDLERDLLKLLLDRR